MKKFEVELQTISNGYDRKTCWVHARPAAIPGNPITALVTMQPMRLTGDDVFYEIHDSRTDDGGVTWSAPKGHPTSLGRRAGRGNTEEGVSDFTAQWHASSKSLLGIGHTVLYQNDDLPPVPRPRSTVYSRYFPESREWAPWRKLELPDKIKFDSEGAGSTQRFDLENGDILLPTYYGLNETARPPYFVEHAATVLRCRFDGETLSYVEHGDELMLHDGYGFAEPSLARLDGKFFLTLRNGTAGYVCHGDDGLHFSEPKKWTFDDGSDLGNYNTQQHWVTGGGGLYLVYTRRGANNDHIMRHRAPLFIAQVDPERVCVIRETERILVPERGARLCNFGVTRIDENESWVAVAEWMQTTLPDPFDSTICEKHGSDNSVYVAKIRF